MKKIFYALLICLAVICSVPTVLAADLGSNTYAYPIFGSNPDYANRYTSKFSDNRLTNSIYSNGFSKFDVNKNQDNTNSVNTSLTHNKFESNANSGVTYNQNVALMYHKLSDIPEELSAFCITPEEFEKDILYLKEQGFTFRTASEADNPENLKGKNVYITFDDGYDNDYLITLPILEKHKVKATFFIIGSQLGKLDHITQEHLVELSKSPYVEIASHSYELHTKTLEEIKTIYGVGDTPYLVSDFVNNAIYLENLIGKRVTALSYPNGIWTSIADEALRNAGYIATFTSDEKIISAVNAPLGRFNRYPDRDAEKIITSFVAPVKSAVSSVKTEVKAPSPFPQESTDKSHTIDFSSKTWGIAMERINIR